MTERPFWFFPVVAAWGILFVPAAILAPIAVFLAGRPEGSWPLTMVLGLGLPVTFGAAVVGMLVAQRRGRIRTMRWWAAAPAIHLAVFAMAMVLSAVVGS